MKQSRLPESENMPITHLDVGHFKVNSLDIEKNLLFSMDSSLVSLMPIG